MKTDTGDKILAYLKTNKQARAIDILHYLKISNQALHKQLSSLVGKGLIEKNGRPPRVFYSLVPRLAKNSEPKFYNWSTDEEAFKKADPKGYEIWRLEQMINYGKEGERISERAVRENWENIKDGLDPAYREYLRFLLWPHQQVS